MTLATNNLSILRGGKLAVDEVTASFAQGEITAIVGPNGAGKSSLLMGLAGLLKPAAGAVALGGESLAALPAQSRAKALGYLPQSSEIAWDVAVENLIALGRLPYRDARCKPVDAAIKVMALEHLRERPVGRLSGGETARALLARVLAGEPQWILADEPLAALDLGHQLGLIAHLKACAQGGQGVIIVLHDLALAMNHADRVVVLQEGRRVADGPPAQALSHDTIANVWNVKAEWVGEPGRQALTVLGHG